MATLQEFRDQQPSFEPGDRTLFAIDIYVAEEKHTFFILAKNAYLIPCDGSDHYPVYDYTDPAGEEADYPSKKNRVGSVP